jgi:hypothetical protein
MTQDARAWGIKRGRDRYDQFDMQRERPGFQERLEASRGGRAAISSLVVAILASVVLWNAGELGFVDLPQGTPYADAVRTTGLQQGWRMFAPPPAASTRLVFDLEYADGTVRRWHWPGEHRGQYRGYHWRKVDEAMVQGRSRELREDFSRWLLAGDRQGVGERPIAVESREHWALLTPPGEQRHVLHRHDGAVLRVER